MKKALLLLLIFTIILISCKKESVKLNPKNYLSEFNNSTIQTFRLDTLNYFEIIGEKGTKIQFEREKFDVPKSKKIQAELTEIYDFKDIIYKNISTITSKGELLETSGVIRIDFKSGDKLLNLKKNSKLIVQFPEGKLKNNKLFSANLNKLNQVKWNEEIQNDTLFSIHIGGGIWAQKIIDKDSIFHFKNENLESIGFETIQEALKESIAFEKIESVGLFSNLGLINIDKVVKPNYFLNFDLIIENEDIDNFCIYFIYENLNSFISDFRTSDNLTFKNIPIKNSTKVVIIGEYKDDFFVDIITLNSFSNHSKIISNLEKKTKNQVKNIFEK